MSQGSTSGLLAPRRTAAQVPAGEAFERRKARQPVNGRTGSRCNLSMPEPRVTNRSSLQDPSELQVTALK